MDLKRDVIARRPVHRGFNCNIIPTNCCYNVKPSVNLRSLHYAGSLPTALKLTLEPISFVPQGSGKVGIFSVEQNNMHVCTEQFEYSTLKHVFSLNKDQEH